LILEAVRRLRDGTWNLDLEDLEQAQFLLPSVGAAVADHIQFEEKFVFPGLGASQRDAHRREHAELLSVLWGLDIALRRRSAGEFHALLDVLSVLLRMHHGAAQEIPDEREFNNVIQIDFMRRISHRSEQFILESV
jgi:hypothetical protein